VAGCEDLVELLLHIAEEQQASEEMRADERSTEERRSEEKGDFGQHLRAKLD